MNIPVLTNKQLDTRLQELEVYLTGVKNALARRGARVAPEAIQSTNRHLDTVAITREKLRGTTD